MVLLGHEVKIEIQLEQDMAAATTGYSKCKYFGGNAQSITESWNGTSWTEVADLNTARRY